MSDENDILDEIIDDLRTRLKNDAGDFNARMKLTDRLMKAISMRRKQQAKKGRGFDLGGQDGSASTRN
jgi:hypothetical protein